MINLDKKLTKILSYSFVAGLIFSIGIYSGVQAAGYSGTVYGRAAYRGYFTNNLDYNGFGVLPVISEGLAIPNYVNTVGELIKFLKNANDSGNTQKVVGSAFIVNTMLGRDGPGKGKDVSNADWTDLTNRLNDRQARGKIKWTGNVDATINSYYQGSGDDAFYSNPKNESGIRIYSDSGNLVYELLRKCANPMGDTIGLPKVSQWTVSTTSAVTSIFDAGDNIIAGNTTTALPGHKITWKHSVKNKGPQSTGLDVNYYFQNTGSWFLGTGKGGDHNFDSPKSMNASGSFDSTYTVLPTDVGKNICRQTWAKPESWSSDGTTKSTSACVSVDNVVVAKKPKVQVWGGDLSVGRRFDDDDSINSGAADVRTSVSANNGNIFGSWVEYGIYARGTITGTSSGSGLSGGLVGLANVCSFNMLSFANVPDGGSQCTGAPDTIGNYSNARSIPDVAASFPTSPSTPSLTGAVSAQGLSSGTYTAGDLTLNASILPATGKYVVIKSTGTVNIVGNQGYTDGPYSNLSQLPQLIIIASKIIIHGNVTQVDAWLIAKKSDGLGQIDTCDIIADTTAKCNLALMVNGPVMTQHLNLRRTAGVSTDDGAAEIFNLRPDAYLWAYTHAFKSGVVRTVYSTELPPRL